MRAIVYSSIPLEDLKTITVKGKYINVRNGLS